MKCIIDTGWASLSKYGEELCGDNVEVLKTPDYVVAVLADGLGSGVKANILSKMTAKIIVTMLDKGTTLEEVVETITNTLPVCQKRNLAYSTFTIVQVKTDGEAYIVQFDNPSIFYLHRGKVQHPRFDEVEICGKRIKESRFRLDPGDSLVAVSDGVIHAGIGQMLNLGWQWENVAEYLERISSAESSAAEISQGLLSVCDQLYANQPGDDVTVLSLRYRQPKTMTLLVGPPRNAADDPKIVEAIMAEPGRRVVCGGTTSMIVSRYLGEKIEVDLSRLDPELPPTGKLKGIDLVTEGIITLTKVLEKLKKEAPLPPFGKTNGADELAKLLMDSDEIRFIVGRAINPAHQNPELPLNLNLKMQVVTEITEVLQRRGKQVTVEYY